MVSAGALGALRGLPSSNATQPAQALVLLVLAAVIAVMLCALVMPAVCRVLASRAGGLVSTNGRPIGVVSFRWPWLTTLLLAVFCAVFAAEQRLGVSPAASVGAPTLGSLIALGGLSRALVQSGEWYRMLTAPFLHASAAHLVANAVAFLLAGWLLERLVGRAWMLSIFTAGALAGSVASLLVSAPTTVSVGASGAIMAMLVALFAVSFRLAAGPARMQIQAQSLRIAIPALVPFLHVTGARIDYGAHFGGALLGGAAGLLLLALWPATAPLPRFRSGAAVFAGVAALWFGLGGIAVARHYPAYAAPPPTQPPAYAAQR